MGSGAADHVRDALDAGHGMLDDDVAVFGLTCSAEIPPDWIDDDAEVGRRICAKPTDALDTDLWWRVVDIARICRRLARISAADDATLRQVGKALRKSLRVAGELPWPPPSLRRTPGRVVDVTAPGPHDPRVDPIGAAAARLCTAVDDRGWVDPDALAGWLDDAVLALRAYGMQLEASSMA